MGSAVSEDQDKALGNSLLQMADNRDLNDVILVCKDGNQVHACRLLLAERSSFFRQMLFDGMTEESEPRRTSFELPTVPSSVLLIILKFLYSEVLPDDDIRKSKSFGSRRGAEMCSDDEGCDNERFDIFFRLDWEFLLEVVTAARFLMIERLETVIIERMWNDVPKMEAGSVFEHDLSAVARSLSTLCEYNTLWNAGEVTLTDNIICCRWEPTSLQLKSVEVICSQLMQILIFYELRASTFFNLSRKAFLFYLSKRRKTSRSSDETWDWCIEEYLKLREIFTWCAVRAVDSKVNVEHLDRTCLPGPELALRFIQDCDRYRFRHRSFLENYDRFSDSPFYDSSYGSMDDYPSYGSMHCFSSGRQGFARRIGKDDLEQFLPMVDLVSVHPELLVNVIGPLGLVDDQRLSRIYSVQAMRGSKTLRKNAMHQSPHVWNWVGSGLYSLRTPFCDNMTFTVSVETPSTRKLCVVAVAELQMHFPRKYEWEIIVTPHGLLQFQYMNVLEIGFYGLRHGECLRQMVQHEHGPSSSRLSDDRRASVLKIPSEEEFYDRGAFKRSSGHAPGSSRTLWNKPLKVMLNREDSFCSFSSPGPGGHESTFPIRNAEDEVFYPAVYIQTNDAKHIYDHDYDVPRSTLQPHYDRLTVKIRCLKGFDESICVKLEDSWTQRVE